MPLITRIHIHVTESLVGLRNKISFIADELGIPAIRTARLAAACSETARDLLNMDISPIISISLSDNENKQLKIGFSPWNEHAGQTSTCQRYLPLVDQIEREPSALIYCQQLDNSIEIDKNLCTQLFEKMQRTVVPTRAELEIQATHDALTHLLNRYALEEGFNMEMERARRYGFPVSVLMIDIDYFKHINDTYGHHAGDACLAELSTMMLSVSRKQDIAARFGGEEFVLVLPHTGPQEASRLAERFRKKVEATPVNYKGECIHFTVSIGISGFDMAIEINCKQLLEMADQALYEAKESGRNRICIRQPTSVA